MAESIFKRVTVNPIHQKRRTVLTDPSLYAAEKKCKKLGIHQCTRTILMCMDTGTAKCASGSQMKESWKYLKSRLKELKLSHRGGIFRIKTQCNGVCRGGPIITVMPEGVWYGGCNPEAIERIIQQHFLNGQIVDDLVIARSMTDSPITDIDG